MCYTKSLIVQAIYENNVVQTTTYSSVWLHGVAALFNCARAKLTQAVMTIQPLIVGIYPPTAMRLGMSMPPLLPSHITACGGEKFTTSTHA